MQQLRRGTIRVTKRRTDPGHLLIGFVPLAGYQYRVSRVCLRDRKRDRRSTIHFHQWRAITAALKNILDN